MDTVAKLTAQIRSLEQGKGFCFPDEDGAERHYAYLCALMREWQGNGRGQSPPWLPLLGVQPQYVRFQYRL